MGFRVGGLGFRLGGFGFGDYEGLGTLLEFGV